MKRRLRKPRRGRRGLPSFDEDAGVEEVFGEADAVAQQCAVRERLEGSTEMTPTVSPSARTCRTSAAISDDLPTPGGPVMPIGEARTPCRG